MLAEKLGPSRQMPITYQRSNAEQARADSSFIGCARSQFVVQVAVRADGLGPQSLVN